MQRINSPRDDRFVSGSTKGLRKILEDHNVLWIKFLSRVNGQRGEETTVLIMTGPMDGRGGRESSFVRAAGLADCRVKTLFNFVRNHDEKAKWAEANPDAWILIDDDERCLKPWHQMLCARGLSNGIARKCCIGVRLDDANHNRPLDSETDQYVLAHSWKDVVSFVMHAIGHLKTWFEMTSAASTHARDKKREYQSRNITKCKRLKTEPQCYNMPEACLSEGKGPLVWVHSFKGYFCTQCEKVLTHTRASTKQEEKKTQSDDEIQNFTNIPEKMRDWCDIVNSKAYPIPVLHEVCRKATKLAARSDVQIVVSVVRNPANDVQTGNDHKLAYHKRIKWRWNSLEKFQRDTVQQSDRSWRGQMRRRYDDQGYQLTSNERNDAMFVLQSFPIQ